MENEPESQYSPGLRGWWERRKELWLDTYQANPLLRHLIHEPLFFVAVFALLFVALGIGVMLPKIWDPTPPDFSKRVRVSVLDYVQAWSLRRAGEKAIHEGRWEDALGEYRGAVANNLADLRSLRGLLRVLRDAPWTRTANLRTLFLATDFTLELSRTNRGDALLVADVLERHRLAELSLETLRPWESDFTPEEDRVHCRALLTSGRITQFRTRVAAHPERFNDDPILRLYRAAVDAGWGTPEQVVPALETLRSALADPQRRIAAARMLCAAALQRDDPVDYERALKTLRESESTMVQDEAMWWELLARHGRADEAKKLAKGYDKVPPPTPYEAVQLARTWLGLGMPELGTAMFKNHAAAYGQSLEVWSTYLDLLMLKGEWNDVRRVAAQLRVNSSSRDALIPVALYADIRADLAEGRRNVVRDAIQKLKTTPISSPILALRFASGLNAAGEPETAHHLLSQVRTNFQDSREFWLEMVFATRGLRDTVGMRQAADRLAELAPQDITAQTIRLVTLLGTREAPTDALALSLRVTQASPPSPSLAINHAMALLLNRRADEAIALLDAIPAAALNQDEVNSFAIARTDALAQKGRYVEAAKIGATVDSTVLLPPQEAWFRDLLHECRKHVEEQTGAAKP